MTTGVTGDDDGMYRDYEQGYDQGYDVSQHISLRGAHDDDTAPAPGSPTRDSWYEWYDDDVMKTERPQSRMMDWYESHYNQSEWGDSEA